MTGTTNYKELFDALIPKAFNYDRDTLTDTVKVQGLVALIESMPSHDRLPTAFRTAVQVRGWCEKSNVYMDVLLYPDGSAKHAYIGNYGFAGVEPDRWFPTL